CGEAPLFERSKITADTGGIAHALLNTKRGEKRSYIMRDSIGAITIGLERAYWITLLIRRFESSFIGSLCIDLLMLTLPVLFAFVYRTSAVLQPSRIMRYLALTTSLILGGIAIAPGMYRWALELQRNLTNIRLFGGTTLAVSVWNWFQEGDSGSLTWRTLSLLSQLAYFFFLVACFRQSDGSPRHITPQLQHLRSLALFATVAIGLAVVMSLGMPSVTRDPSILHKAIHTLPSLCWVVGPLIVYKSIPRISGTPAE
ncbi:MAG: hypothetical protein ABSG25_08640, partial [Bryobacteraceae bacterium]